MTKIIVMIVLLGPLLLSGCAATHSKPASGDQLPMRDGEPHVTTSEYRVHEVPVGRSFNPQDGISFTLLEVNAADNSCAFKVNAGNGSAVLHVKSGGFLTAANLPPKKVKIFKITNSAVLVGVAGGK